MWNRSFFLCTSILLLVSCAWLLVLTYAFGGNLQSLRISKTRPAAPPPAPSDIIEPEPSPRPSATPDFGSFQAEQTVDQQAAVAPPALALLDFSTRNVGDETIVLGAVRGISPRALGRVRAHVTLRDAERKVIKTADGWLLSDISGPGQRTSFEVRFPRTPTVRSADVEFFQGLERLSLMRAEE